MSSAYVDTSVVVAIAFGEPEAGTISQRLGGFDRLYASNLLEAELLSVCRRKGRAVPENLVSRFHWVFPVRRLTAELRAVLGAGYVRRADLWHLACALYVAPNPAELSFLTRDQRQADVAAELRFQLD